MSDYTTLDALMKEKVNRVWEHNGYYYVELKPKQFYENAIWKVDKITGKASYMMFTEFLINVKRFATPVDPNELKRAS